MRRSSFALLAVLLLPAAGLTAFLGCNGGDGGTGPGPEPCAIDITTPLPNTHYFSGDAVNLRWDAAGGGTVMVTLLKAGAVVDTLAAATENDGYFYWAADTRGALSGDDFALSIVSNGDAGCGDSVPIGLTNTVGCMLALTVNPDTLLVAGQDFLITWDSENTSGTVDLELWKGTLDIELVAPLAQGIADNGSYLWQNVDSFHQGSAVDYHLRIADSVTAGCEDMTGMMRMQDTDVCSIFIMTPVNDQVLTEGQPFVINFEADPETDFVQIRLYALGTLIPGSYIVDDLPAASGQFTWTVSDYGWTGANNVYRIVITDENDSYCVGRSETFTIQ